MRRKLAWSMVFLASTLAALSGCTASKPPGYVNPDSDHYRRVALEVEYANSDAPCYDDLVGSAVPRSIRDSSRIQYWDLTLQEAIRYALCNSKVMLDLGGTILRSPQTTPNTFGPAVQESDPQYGVEAALSAFDAEFSSGLFFEKNDRRLNNRFVGRNGIFMQDYDTFTAAISKRTATGGLFTVRNNVEFDKDTNLGNQFPDGAWTVMWEGEMRHPLLQGAGLNFNRIAGPSGRPGVFNGVVVARLRTDISLADFEIGIRDLVSNVENAYWDLYFAYRDLDTKTRARDTALETWRRINALYRAGRRGGEAEKEAQAREQLYRFEEEVQNALVGRPVEGTRTNNGSSPGTFRGTPGVFINERKLRLLAGLPANDDRMIRPADEPPISPVVFDWSSIACDALVEREELRRQRFEIRAREMELIAAKNFLLPNLDLVGRYRFRGFGQGLINYDVRTSGGVEDPFDDAYSNLMLGNFQEWQLGMEFSLPIGFRQAHAGVRHAELRVMQSRSVLRQQERQVISDLSNAVAELDRAYVVLQTDINRTIAARQQLDALQAAYDADKAEFFVVLDAQRRLADAESRYYQSRVEYALALRNVYFEKGELLDYCGVGLAEGPSPAKAYSDAAEREHMRGRPISLDYTFHPSPWVSAGPRPNMPVAPDGVSPAEGGLEQASQPPLPPAGVAAPADQAEADQRTRNMQQDAGQMPLPPPSPPAVPPTAVPPTPPPPAIPPSTPFAEEPMAAVAPAQEMVGEMPEGPYQDPNEP